MCLSQTCLYYFLCKESGTDFQFRQQQKKSNNAKTFKSSFHSTRYPQQFLGTAKNRFSKRSAPFVFEAHYSLWKCCQKHGGSPRRTGLFLSDYADRCQSGGEERWCEEMEQCYPPSIFSPLPNGSNEKKRIQLIKAENTSIKHIEKGKEYVREAATKLSAKRYLLFTY